MTEWIGSRLRDLDELTAYDAMCAFLEAYWEQGGKSSEDIATLLGSLSREVWANGMPGDPASWSDWRTAVDAALQQSR